MDSNIVNFALLDITALILLIFIQYHALQELIRIIGDNQAVFLQEAEISSLIMVKLLSIIVQLISLAPIQVVHQSRVLTVIPQVSLR